jgi:hypothetical protein
VAAHPPSVKRILEAISQCRRGWRDAVDRDPTSAELSSALHACLATELQRAGPQPARPALTEVTIDGVRLRGWTSAEPAMRWALGPPLECELFDRPPSSRAEAPAVSVELVREGDVLVAHVEDRLGVAPASLDPVLAQQVLPEAVARLGHATSVRLRFGGTLRLPEIWPAPRAAPAPAARLTDAPAVGVAVVHASFGRGRVTSVEGKGPSAIVHVAFEASGAKKVQARFLAPS